MNDPTLVIGDTRERRPAPQQDVATDVVELVSSQTCPFAQRTRMVLLAKGIDFKFTEISLDDKPAWFLALSPYGKVPLLRHGETVLWESAVINEYLNEVFADPPLLPAAPAARAKARIWIDFANNRMVPHVYKMMLQQDLDGQELHRERLTQAVTFMEQEGLARLAEGAFWNGARPGLVDYSFFPHMQRFVALRHYRGFEMPAECRRLRTWLDAMHARPEVQATRAEEAVLIRNWSKYAHNTSTGTTARDMREV